MIGAQVLLASPSGPVRARDATVGHSLTTFVRPGAPGHEIVSRVRFRRATGPLVRLVTAGGKEVTLSAQHRVFARLAPGDDLFDVMLVERHGTGHVVGIGAGQLRDLTESRTLLERRSGSGPTVLENIWILSSLRDLPSATFVEHLLALRHGLPVFDIEPSLRRSNIPEPMLLRLLAALDTGPRALRLLAEFQLDPATPHFRRRMLAAADLAGHQVVKATLNAASLPPHRAATTIARAHGHPRKDAQAAQASHQIQCIRLSEAIQFDRQNFRHVATHDEAIESFDDPRSCEARLEQLARQSHTDACLRIVLVPPRPSLVYTAAAIRPGMIVCTLQDGSFAEELVRTADLVESDTEIFEPALEESLGLVAGGIVVGTREEPGPGEHQQASLAGRSRQTAASGGGRTNA